uniref:Transmembrane protein n=1 Tax=Elaeophora elaphi TaxID=1147741 RepID=A0A0R3S3Y6_9BILA
MVKWLPKPNNSGTMSGRKITCGRLDYWSREMVVVEPERNIFPKNIVTRNIKKRYVGDNQIAIIFIFLMLRQWLMQWQEEGQNANINAGHIGNV